MHNNFDKAWYYGSRTTADAPDFFHGLVCKQRCGALQIARRQRQPPAKLWLFLTCPLRAFCQRFRRAHANAYGQAGCGLHMRTQAPAEMLKILTTIDAGQIQEHLINGILLYAGRHFFQYRHYALRHAVVYVEWKIYRICSDLNGCYERKADINHSDNSSRV